MEKQIEAWLIADYKNGKVRVIKRLPKGSANLKPSEIPIQLKLKVEVPDNPQMIAEATIKLGKREITDLMFEEGKDEHK